MSLLFQRLRRKKKDRFFSSSQKYKGSEIHLQNLPRNKLILQQVLIGIYFLNKLCFNMSDIYGIIDTFEFGYADY